MPDDRFKRQFSVGTMRINAIETEKGLVFKIKPTLVGLVVKARNMRQFSQWITGTMQQYETTKDSK